MPDWLGLGLRWRQEALSKPHNLQTHAQGCISHHPIGCGNNRHRQISRHREMQSTQRAEGMFRITRDQISCFRKACIIKRITLQPATIDIVENGCK